MTFLPNPADLENPSARMARLERRLARERTARFEAERLLETKSRELWALNSELRSLNAELEARVTDRTAALENARCAAVRALETDYLTSIASRYAFGERLDQAVDRALSGASAVGLLLIDVDDFKGINDSLGHSYGDAVLMTLAARLKRALRDTDLVARIGGDEFAVIIEAECAADVKRAARRLSQVFDAPIASSGVTFQCSGSMGLALAPGQARNADDIQRYADLALYRVKARGGRGVACFAPSLLHAAQTRQAIEADLRRAIAEDSLEVHFQPVVDLASERASAVEALVRWRNARGEMMSPSEFVPLAEQCGLVGKLGRQLLRKSLIAAKPWLAAGLIERLSFNVSPIELLDRNFERGVLRALQEEGFPADRLVLEITEGVVLRNLDAARRVMESLLGYGVAFAMDDFGSGYSNLAYLRDLPLRALKIDGKLIRNVEADAASQAIVRNIVALCRDLGIVSVCEGVETSEQVAFLRSIGCDRGQGYFFSPPRPSAVVPDGLGGWD